MDSDLGTVNQLNVDLIPSIGSYRMSLSDARLHWSTALLKVYGRETPPENERAFYQCVHPDDRVRVETEARAIMDQGLEYSHVFRIVRPDGTIRTILDRGIVERAANGQPLSFQGINVDITRDLRRAGLEPEEGLGPDGILHAARALTVVRAAGLGTYELNLQDHRSSWSHELLRLIGRERDHLSPSMDLALQYVHDEDRDRVIDTMQRAVLGPGAYDLEYRIVSENGGIRWMRDRGTAVGKTPDGRPERMVGVMTDITDRKAAENEVKRVAGLLGAIFQNAPIGLAAFDKDFRYLQVNRKLSEINGLSVEEHIGKRPDQLFPGLAGLDEIYDLWSGILAGGPPVMNHELVGETSVNGRRIWCEHFFPILEDSKITGIAGIIEDVTEQRRADAERRASFDRMRRVLDSTIALVGVLTPDGTMVEVNQVALSAGGLKREDVIGAKFWETYWWSFDASTAGRLKASVASAAAGQRVRYDVEVRLANESRMTIDFLLAPVFDAEGKVEYLIPSGFDVTERNRAVAQRQLLMQEVNHRSKNMLTLAISIARQTAKTDPNAFLAKFTDRLRSLATLQDDLVRGNWDTIELRHLIESQLMHFKDDIGKRIHIEGPELMVNAEAAQSLALVIYELSTNSGKYGALSSLTGNVRLNWSVGGSPDTPTFSLDWVEGGGPEVRPSTRRGFGFSLMHGMIEAACNGKAESHFDPSGFRWHLRDAKNCIVAGPAA